MFLDIFIIVLFIYRHIISHKISLFNYNLLEYKYQNSNIAIIYLYLGIFKFQYSQSITNSYYIHFLFIFLFRVVIVCPIYITIIIVISWKTLFLTWIGRSNYPQSKNYQLTIIPLVTNHFDKSTETVNFGLVKQLTQSDENVGRTRTELRSNSKIRPCNKTEPSV